MEILNKNLKRKNIFYSGAIVALMFIAINVWAEKPTGAAFLKINPSVRNHALGGYHPALSFGSQAVGSNPANIQIMKSRYEVMSSYASLLGESNYVHVTGALRQKDRAWAGAITRLQSGSQDQRDISGAKIGTFDSHDTAASMSYAQRISKKVRVGITGRILKSELGGYSSNAVFGGDFGASFLYKKALIGLSVLNLGSDVTFLDESAPLPTSYSLGTAVPFGDFTLVVSMRHLPNDSKTHVSLGGEYEMGMIHLRTGYRTETGRNLARQSQQTGQQVLGGLSAGMGIKIKDLKLDYSLNQEAVEFGMSHRFSLTYFWGQNGRKKN